jgi:hypothetical protein
MHHNRSFLLLACQALQAEAQLALEQREHLLNNRGFTQFYHLSIEELRLLRDKVAACHEQGLFSPSLYKLLTSFLRERIDYLKGS